MLGHVDGDRIEVYGLIVTCDKHRVVAMLRQGIVRVTQHRVHILHLTESLEKRNQIQQLRIGHIVEPRRNWHLQIQ